MTKISRKMTSNYIVVNSKMNISQVMRSLVDQAADKDNISVIYVTDDKKIYVGAIDLKDLIIARKDTPLRSVINTDFPYVYENECVEDCIEVIKGYQHESVPVIDSCKRLTGVITAKDITEMVDYELSEDYAKFAALTDKEDMSEPLGQSIRKRLPWLICLLGLGLIVSSVVGIFERIASHITVIVSFQSLILGMAGNTGTQSLAVTIRVMTNKRITAKERIYLIIKEARIGIINGIILGIISFIAVGIYLISFKKQAVSFAFSVSVCTGISLMISMVLASISGTAVPLTFKRLGIDPAVASGPLITTLNDLAAVITYYGLAWILLINILQF